MPDHCTVVANASVTTSRKISFDVFLFANGDALLTVEMDSARCGFRLDTIKDLRAVTEMMLSVLPVAEPQEVTVDV